MHLVTTPNGPIGPFYHFALTPDNTAGVMANAKTRGERISVVMRMIDSAGIQVTNAMIELWQADANGIYNSPADPKHAGADPNFHGFGRLATDEEGICVFDTVKPGPVAGADEQVQAPHINVAVYAPGLLRRITTRMYFEGNPLNDSDSILGLVPPERRNTLIAQQGAEVHEWRFEIRLAGDCETVFFDV